MHAQQSVLYASAIEDAYARYADLCVDIDGLRSVLHEEEDAIVRRLADAKQDLLCITEAERSLQARFAALV